MIDLETLGTGPKAVVTQIGACVFDYTGNVENTLIRNIRIGDNITLNRTFTEGSLKFWLDDKNEVTFLNNTVSVSRALNELSLFLSGYDIKTVWSHATFDMPILSSLFMDAGIKNPLSYRKMRDLRTVVDLSGLRMNPNDFQSRKTHNALDDCMYQVEYLTRCRIHINNALLDSVSPCK